MANTTAFSSNKSTDSFDSPYIDAIRANVTEKPKMENYIIINSTLMSIGVLTLVLHLMLLAALKDCQRLPNRVKILALNFVISDSILLFVSPTMTLVLFVADRKYFQLIYNTRLALTIGLYAVSWGMTVGFAIERLVTLTMPFHHRNWLNKRNCVVFIVAMWMLNFVIPVFVYTIQVVQCGVIVEQCSLSHIFDINRMTYTILFSVYTLIILTSFVKISKIVNSQIRKIHSGTFVTYSSQVKQFQLTRALLSIIMAYTMFHLPIVVYTAIFLVRPNLENPAIRQVLQALSFICMLSNSYLSIYLFIWKIPECRLKFLLKYLSWISKYRQQANELKTEVFNLPFTSR